MNTREYVGQYAVKLSQIIHFEMDRSGLQNVPVHWLKKMLHLPPLDPPMVKMAPQECVGDTAKET